MILLFSRNRRFFTGDKVKRRNYRLDEIMTGREADGQMDLVDPHAGDSLSSTQRNPFSFFEEKWWENANEIARETTLVAKTEEAYQVSLRLIQEDEELAPRQKNNMKRT